MKEILKLQYSYLFNKVSAWFLFLMISIATVGIVYASGFTSLYGELDIDRSTRLINYQMESYLLVKFILVVISIFLSIQGYYSQFTKYHLFFLQKEKGKVFLGIAKQTAIMVVLSMMFIHTVIVIHLAGFYLTPYFQFEIDFFFALISLFIEAMILGLIGSISIQIIDSIFSGLIPLVLFWVTEANATYEEITQSSWLKTLYAIVSNAIIYQNKFVLLYDMIHYGLVFLFLWFLNLLIFIWKDIK